VWRCGSAVWYINGVEVPRQVVEAPETLTVDQIRNERNGDVQRIMLEIFGLVRFIEETKAEMLDERECRVSNTLEQLYVILGRKVLLAVDPSGAGIASMNVPVTVDTCEAAQNWLNPFSNTKLIGRT
jgi:hypothetical protein